MAERTAQHVGRLMARALTLAWRPAPPPLQVSPGELAEMAPLLVAAGAGGLVWLRLTDPDLQAGEPGLLLQQAYRLQLLKNACVEQQIPEIVTLLRSQGVEPLLIKGWSIAGSYPQRGMRLYGDIDLCVPPEQHDAAARGLGEAGVGGYPVDLHRGFANKQGCTLDESRWSDLFQRSRTAVLGGVPVRILGPEDHFRLVCIHALRHGVDRAVWLCDVAALLESRPAGFDWDLCLRPARERSDWVACAVGLAGHLLGANLEGCPAEALPPWLVPTILHRWGDTSDRLPRPLSSCFWEPAAAWRRLRLCWPSPLDLAARWWRPLRSMPARPLQLRAFAANATHAFVQMALDLSGPARRRLGLRRSRGIELK